MGKVEENSFRRKIKKSSSSQELNEIADQICSNWDEWPRSLYFDMKNRILQGSFLSEQCLVKLILLSKSRTLYNYRTVFSIDSQITLMTAGLPDIDLEKKIAEYTAENLRKQNYGSIDISLKALRDFGSLASLTILEVAQFDISTNLQIEKMNKKLFGEPNLDNLNFEGITVYSKKLTSSLNIRLADLLKEAIESIRKRNKSFESMSFDWSTL